MFIIQIFKKLFLNINFLINKKHLFFYLTTAFLVILFIVFNKNLDNSNNFFKFLLSIGKSVLISLPVSLFSTLIGIFLMSLYIAVNFKIIKHILDLIFNFPSFIYISVTLLYINDFNIYKIIMTMSMLRGYELLNILIKEIDSIKNQRFILSLHSIGFNKIAIITKHILPLISINLIIFFFETIIWFMGIEFILGFINFLPFDNYVSPGGLLYFFYKNQEYILLLISVMIFYVFIMELSYVINNIKLKFEIIFQK